MKLSPILLVAYVLVVLFALFELTVIGHQNRTIQSQRALIRLQQKDSDALAKCQVALSRHCTGAVPSVKE